MRQAWRHLSLAVLVWSAGPWRLAAQPVKGAPELRVMSFNLRYGTAADGDNQWSRRQDLLADTINRYQPDLLGTQEGLDFQIDFLRQQMPRYTVFGVGREDGQRKGEFAAIFYRTDRFEVVESGHYWLSPTPDKPGSVGWDAAQTRMVTWMKLRIKGADAPLLLVQNTHLDDQGAKARLESARMMRNFTLLHGKECALLLMGDFNTAVESEPMAALSSVRDGGPPLFDSYRRLHPNPEKDEGTFHDFTGKRNRSPRIDWILVSSGMTVRESAIDHSSRDNHYPSDHFPVTAVLRVDY
jgi:endonuclease/exonuclease/phosphatase family metal-dependent hydrolase